MLEGSLDGSFWFADSVFLLFFLEKVEAPKKKDNVLLCVMLLIGILVTMALVVLYVALFGHKRHCDNKGFAVQHFKQQLRTAGLAKHFDMDVLHFYQNNRFKLLRIQRDCLDGGLQKGKIQLVGISVYGGAGNRPASFL